MTIHNRILSFSNRFRLYKRRVFEECIGVATTAAYLKNADKIYWRYSFSFGNSLGRCIRKGEAILRNEPSSGSYRNKHPRKDAYAASRPNPLSRRILTMSVIPLRC